MPTSSATERAMRNGSGRVAFIYALRVRREEVFEIRLQRGQSVAGLESSRDAGRWL